MKQVIKKVYFISQFKWQLASIIFAAGFAFTLFQYAHLKNQINGPSVDNVVQKLSKVMVLPDETPKIIPLRDIQLLKTNWPDLYHNAQPNSILIQYQNSSVLFDPEKNKILNIISYGVFNKPKPAEILRISFRYDGNELYRALYLKRQIEENQLNSAYQITEVIPSRVLYKDDVIYLVNKEKKGMAIQFSKAIGNSPLVEKEEPNEASTEADIIVAFKSIL